MIKPASPQVIEIAREAMYRSVWGFVNNAIAPPICTDEEVDELTEKFVAGGLDAVAKFLGNSDDTPRPDWSQAPAWAVWWAISADGCVTWYEAEPQLLAAFGEWTVPLSVEVRHDGMIDIPLGIDWRLLKMERPTTAQAIVELNAPNEDEVDG